MQLHHVFKLMLPIAFCGSPFSKTGPDALKTYQSCDKVKQSYKYSGCCGATADNDIAFVPKLTNTGCKLVTSVGTLEFPFTMMLGYMQPGADPFAGWYESTMKSWRGSFEQLSMGTQVQFYDGTKAPMGMTAAMQFAGNYSSGTPFVDAFIGAFGKSPLLIGGCDSDLCNTADSPLLMTVVETAPTCSMFLANSLWNATYTAYQLGGMAAMGAKLDMTVIAPMGTTTTCSTTDHTGHTKTYADLQAINSQFAGPNYKYTVLEVADQVCADF